MHLKQKAPAFKGTVCVKEIYILIWTTYKTGPPPFIVYIISRSLWDLLCVGFCLDNTISVGNSSQWDTLEQKCTRIQFKGMCYPEMPYLWLIFILFPLAQISLCSKEKWLWLSIFNPYAKDSPLSGSNRVDFGLAPSDFRLDGRPPGNYQSCVPDWDVQIKTKIQRKALVNISAMLPRKQHGCIYEIIRS